MWGDGDGLGSGDGDGEGLGSGEADGDGLGSGDGDGDGTGDGAQYGSPAHVTWTVPEFHSVGWRPSPPVTWVRTRPVAQGTSNEMPWPRPPRVSSRTQPPGLVKQPTSAQPPGTWTWTHAVIWT